MDRMDNGVCVRQEGERGGEGERGREEGERSMREIGWVVLGVRHEGNVLPSPNRALCDMMCVCVSVTSIVNT